MSNELDNRIFQLGHTTASIPVVEGATFMLGLKKFAAELEAMGPAAAGAPAADLVAPDTTGAIEGPFLVPLPQAVELMAQMVSNEFKTQVYYTYYANMLRGLAHDSIAEEFTAHAEDELEHASYLLRRIGVLSPGGISIPPYPSPTPMSDPQEIIQEMIVVEQMGLSLWKQLHAVLGDNPMKYTVEQFLQKEEEHQDELWQLVDPVDPTAAPMPTAEPVAEAPAPSPEAPPKTASEILEAAVTRKQAASILEYGMGVVPGAALGNFAAPDAPVTGALAGGVAGGLGTVGAMRLLSRLPMSKVPVGMEIPAAVAAGLLVPAAGATSGYLAGRGVQALAGPRPGENRKEASHALTAEEALAAGFDVKWAGKKERGAPSTAVSGWKGAADLTPAARAQVSESNFVFPKTRKYPIHDEDHALAALGMVGMHGSPKEQSTVRAAVEKKYPGLQMQKKAADRDAVIRGKAKQLLSSATENLRHMTDAMQHPDQTRVEAVLTAPETMRQEKSLFDTKKKDAITKTAVSRLELLLMDALPGAAGGFTGAGDGAGEQALGTLAGGGAGYLAARGMRHLLGKIPNSAIPSGASHPLSVLAAMSAGYGAGRAVRALAAKPSPDATIQPVGEPISVTEKKSALGSLISKLAEDIMLPAPGADSPENYIAREQQLAAQQAMAEASHAKTVSMQSAQAAQQAQAEAQAAQQQLQEAQMQLQQSQQEAQMGSQQALQAQQAASEAEARAAEHSISKMQLGMRVNQMRQELANLVMQDPVSEHAATVSDLAAQGQPATPQQQQEADMAAQQQEMAAQQGAAGGPPPAEAQKQQQEAQNAEQEAQVQGQQAQQAAPGAPPKTAAKLASIMDSVVCRMGREAAAGAGEAVRDTAIDAAKKYGPAAAIAGAGTLALGAAHSSHARSQRKEDMTSAVAEGVRRAKTASPADRRLAREIFNGAHDTLGNELRQAVTHGMPGEAFQAAAGKAVHEAGHQVAEGGAGLLERVRPHLPGAVVGLGAGILGTKMMSGTSQPQQASPLTYAQYYGQ